MTSSSPPSSIPRISLLAVLFLVSHVSAACYYDTITGQTRCDGLSYGARLAIAAAISIIAAIVVTALSYFVRRRIYRNNALPPISAGYYGPPQTQPPSQPGFVPYYPNAYAAPQPNYSGPPQAYPAYAPPGYAYGNGPPQPAKAEHDSQNQPYAPPGPPPPPAAHPHP